MQFWSAFLLALASVPSALPSPANDAVPPLRPSFCRPKSDWNHVIQGSEVKVAKRCGGDLGRYALRVKKVNPSILGVDKVRQYSGYLDDNASDKHLFYWFFDSRNDPENDPVILWLSGGPGCSSMIGLFMEMGPSRIDANGQLVRNEFSWNSNASVIFLDQPVNTGFSYSSSDVSTTKAAAKDVYALMTLFFKQFPEYSKQDFHIAGESYAGHYIPILAAEILSHKDRNINLKSAMIGNGDVDPYTQYATYEPMGCGRGGQPAVLDEITCHNMKEALPQCQHSIKACYDRDVGNCSTAAQNCQVFMVDSARKSGLNIYDIRNSCAGGSLCYKELDWIERSLNQDEVMQALGVEAKRFQICNGWIADAFAAAGDYFQPIQNSVPNLLAQIPILIYAGDCDYIENWLGNQAWTNALEWSGHDAFNSANVTELKTASGKSYGTIKHANGFAFLRVFQAGHSVPYDQPEASLDFVNRWLKGEWSK
ncbi:hypothetical protein EsDP_00001419 [Epichloe bromicola]|uniref:Carboxypeptidase n=1 Tax=Epichloe bromicola TaxID=79588 RepID=A0ABQ0CHT5_9HYPO